MSINRKTPPKDSSQINEMNQEERNAQAAKDSYNDLQEGVFKAVIMSGWGNVSGRTGLYNTGQAMIARNYRKEQVGNFWWYRIRALDGSDDARESLWGGLKGNIANKRIRYTRAVSIIQYHRTAFYDQASNQPKAGEVWLCRYLKKRYQSPIMLIERTKDANYPTPLVLPDKGNLKRDGQLLDKAKFPDEGSKQQSPYKFKGTFTYDDTKTLLSLNSAGAWAGTGIQKIMWFVSHHLHKSFYEAGYVNGNKTGMSIAFNEYDLFNCGYGHTGPNSCEEAERLKYDKETNKIERMMAGSTLSIDAQKITEIGITDLYVELKKFTSGPDTHNEKGVNIAQAGRYNISYLLLDAAKLAGSFPGFDTVYANNSPFNKEMQDALFMWEIFLHYPVIGGYLIGVHDDKVYAADQLAHIWTVFPAQRTRWEDGYGNHRAPGAADAEIKIQKDYSYYYHRNKFELNGKPTYNHNGKTLAVKAWTPGANPTTHKYTTSLGSQTPQDILEKSKKQFLAFLNDLRSKGNHKKLVEIFTYPRK